MGGCPGDYYDKNQDRICVSCISMIPDCEICLYDSKIFPNFVKCTRCVNKNHILQIIWNNNYLFKSNAKYLHQNNCSLGGCPGDYYDKNQDRICFSCISIIPDCETCLYDSQISPHFAKSMKCVKYLKI